MLRFFLSMWVHKVYDDIMVDAIGCWIIRWLIICLLVRTYEYDIYSDSAVHSPTHPLTVHDYVRRAFVIDWCRKQRNLRWCNFTNSVMITSRWCDAEAVHVLRSLSNHFSTIRFTCEGIFVLSSDCNTSYILHSVKSSDRALETIGFDILYT